MWLIQHRVNRSEDLGTVNPAYGAEIDLRSRGDAPGKIILSHDPWTEGECFERWLEEYRSKGFAGPLILNTKEDGLEERARALVEKAGITNYFFLDTALPTLVRYAAGAHRPHFCFRLSAMEPVEQILRFGDEPAWVWVDCFRGEPLAVAELERLPAALRICLVSPELQGQDRARIQDFRRHFSPVGSRVQAVCTKFPADWV